MNKRVFSLLIAIFAALTVSSQSERVSAINNNWNFHLGNIDFDQYQSPSKAILSEVIEWETINIPHTWNDKDAIDEIPGYYRGVGWYKKTIDLTAEKRDKERKNSKYTLKELIKLQMFMLMEIGLDNIMGGTLGLILILPSF